MENLDIAKTTDSLEIDFNAETGILVLKGSSYPANPVEFFEPIFSWVKQYIHEIGKEMTVNIYIDYMNTSSSKCIVDFLELLEEYHQQGTTIKLNWHYEEDDEDIQETGEELCEGLKLPYEIIAY